MFDTEDYLDRNVGQFIFECTKVIPKKERKNIVLFLPLSLNEESEDILKDGYPLTLSRWRKMWKEKYIIKRNVKLPKKKLKSKFVEMFK